MGEIEFNFDISWCQCGKPMALNCKEKFFEKDAKQYFVGISNQMSSYIHQLYLMEKSGHKIRYQINHYRDDISNTIKTEIIMKNNDYRVDLYHNNEKYVKVDVEAVYNPSNMVLLAEDIKIFEESLKKYLEYSDKKDCNLYDEAIKLFNIGASKYMDIMYHLIVKPVEENSYMDIVSNIHFNDTKMLMDANNKNYEFNFGDNNYIEKKTNLNVNYVSNIERIVITKNNEELIDNEFIIN